MLGWFKTTTTDVNLALYNSKFATITTPKGKLYQIPIGTKCINSDWKECKIKEIVIYHN